MKVFISWSGEGKSHQVAIILHDWLPKVFQPVKPYVSSEDTEKGSRWLERINSELKDAEFSIICLTSNNIEEPWINFEAGAIANKMEKAYVTSLLIDLNASDLQGPLKQFQATKPIKEDMFKLAKSLNSVLSEDLKLDQHRLRETFEQWWPELETEFEDVARSRNSYVEKELTDEDIANILEEVLQISRNSAQNVVDIQEAIEEMKKDRGRPPERNREPQPDGSGPPSMPSSSSNDPFDPDDELPF